MALVGKPDDETIERMATPNYNRQHKHFLLRMEPPAEPYDLSKLFSTPQNDAEKSLWAAGLDLLKKLLVFDPERYGGGGVIRGWLSATLPSSHTYHDAYNNGRRLTATEAMAHPFFDEHIKDFGPRTPEAEKPADGGACVPACVRALRTERVVMDGYMMVAIVEHRYSRHI